jgi:methyl-accepting chemotaxis protein
MVKTTIKRRTAMKIRKKLFLLMMALSLVGAAVPLGVILYLNYTRMSLLVHKEISEVSTKHAAAITAWLNNHLYSTRLLAQIMGGYERIPPEQRRSVFGLMVETTVKSDADILGAAMIWEPDALDGLDAAYAHSAGSDAQGRFIPYWSKTGQGGVQVEPLVGYDIPGEGDYYLIPKRTGKELLTAPYVYPVNGVDTLMVTLSAPIMEAGRFLGAVTRDIGIDLVQKQLDSIDSYPGAVAMVYSYNGIIAGHFDKTRVGKRVEETEQDIWGDALPELLRTTQSGGTFTVTRSVPSLKSDILFISAPFSVGEGANSWSFIVGIPNTVIVGPLYQSLGLSALICAAMLVCVAFCAFMTARSISSPITSMMTLLKDISEGEGDLTKTIALSERNEIGDMAHYFNLTLSKIQRLVLSIKKEAQSLTQTGSELASNMTETAASINEITANIKSIKTQTSRQGASVKGTHDTMKQVVENIETLNAQIQKQTDCVSQSSIAVEQMLANIQNVTQTLVKNETNVTKLAKASDVGRSSLQEVSSDIQEIARESAGLLEINAVIENIASQTNLLSMNAAIEAAHAGEAGKGFAVVADEIRKLAESSSEQSKTISDVLNKIKSSIDKITSSTGGVLLNFEAINDGVKTVTDQEAAVRKAMEEQGAGSKTLLESIERLNEITGEVTGSAQKMHQGSHEVIQESKTLEQITAEIEDGMQEMASGTEQIDRAVNRVNDISIENKRQIETLMAEVVRF